MLRFQLDFGGQQFRREYPPEAFYRSYAVQHFDYYVDFLDDPDRLKQQALDRLFREGAHVVCTIWDNGRAIGEILSFKDEPHVALDYWAAAEGWDRTFGRARTLLLQPLAGTAYHFGYSWRSPE